MSKFIVKNKEEYKKIIDKILVSSSEYVALDTETEEFDKEKTHAFDLGLYGIGLYGKDFKIFIPAKFVKKDFQKVLDKFIFIFHNAKFDLLILEKHGFNIDKLKYHDTLIMSWLLNENRRSHKLKDLAHSVLRVKEEKIIKYGDVIKKPILEEYGMFPEEFRMDLARWMIKLGLYCIDDCTYTYKLFFKFKPKLEEQSIWSIYERLELETVKVLMYMELRGIKVNCKYLEKLGKKIETELIQIQADIWKGAGKEFDINSPKQLSQVLFTEKGFKLTDDYRTPTGAYSTNEAALKYLKEAYPKDEVLGGILKYRELFKLHSAFIVGLLSKQRDGVIHTSFKQHGTVTGRLSCVAKDTPILILEGHVPISKIDLHNKNHQYTIGSGGELRKIKNLIFNGYGKLYDVKTGDSKLRCSGDHRLWTSSGWRKAEDLREGDKVFFNRSSFKVQGFGVGENNIRRKQFCAFKNKGEVDSSKDTSAIKQCYKKKVDTFISKSLFKKIRERFKKDSQDKSKSCGVGKQKWKGERESFFRRKTTIRESSDGKKYREDSKRDAFYRIYSEVKSYVVRYAIKVCKNPKASRHLEQRRCQVGRENFSRVFRNSKEIQEEPRGIFRLSIWKSVRYLQNFMVIKKIGGFAWALYGNWGYREISYMLGNEQFSQYFISEGVKNAEYKAHERIPYWKKLFCRFLFPDFKFNGGIRWKTPRNRYKNFREGQRERENYKKDGDSVKEIYVYGGEKPKIAVKENQEVTIDSIEYIGRGELWDLTVDGDSSYITEGLISHNCSAPNLQQLPRRDDEYDIRKAFIPREGYTFVISDLSQIELRIAASISQDPTMLKIFNEGGDIHGETAKLLDCERVIAKQINFGILYGTAAFGMSKGLEAKGVKLDVKEAEKFINRYFSKFKKLEILIEQAKNTLRKKYAITTVFNRKRRFPKYAEARKNRDWKLVAHCERQAINSIIQGSAADIIKVQMRNLSRELPKYGAYLLVQVHDEVICEVPKEKAEEVLKIVVDIMENSYHLKGVPIVANGFISEVWKK